MSSEITSIIGTIIEKTAQKKSEGKANSANNCASDTVKLLIDFGYFPDATEEDESKRGEQQKMVRELYHNTEKLLKRYRTYKAYTDLINAEDWTIDATNRIEKAVSDVAKLPNGDVFFKILHETYIKGQQKTAPEKTATKIGLSRSRYYAKKQVAIEMCSLTLFGAHSKDAEFFLRLKGIMDKD